jgi:hypothetical protein
MFWSTLHFIGCHTHWNWLRDLAFMNLLRIELDARMSKELAKGNKTIKSLAKHGYKTDIKVEESVFHQQGAMLPRWTTFDPKTGKLSIHLESYETVKDILSGKSNGR